MLQIFARSSQLGPLKRRLEAAFREHQIAASVRPGDGWLRVSCQPQDVDSIRSMVNIDARIKVAS